MHLILTLITLPLFIYVCTGLRLLHVLPSIYIKIIYTYMVLGNASAPSSFPIVYYYYVRLDVIILMVFNGSFANCFSYRETCWSFFIVNWDMYNFYSSRFSCTGDGKEFLIIWPVIFRPN